MDRRAVALAALAAVVIAVALRRRRRRSKPVLAVDYDEVCVGYVDAFARYCNEKRGTAVSRDDFHSYQFWLVEGCRLRTREEAIDCVYDFHSSKHFEQMQPIAGAYEALRQLVRQTCAGLCARHVPCARGCAKCLFIILPCD